MFTWVPLALLINAAFAANFNHKGLKGLSSYTSSHLTSAPVVSTSEVVLGGSGLNSGSQIIGSSGLTGAQGFGAEFVSSGYGGANVISSGAPTVYSTGALGGEFVSTGISGGANVISSGAPTVYTTSTVGGDASLLSAAGPAFTGAQFVSSPAYSSAGQVIYNGYSTIGAPATVVSRQSSTTPAVIKNAYKTITEVEPGKEIVLRAQAQPQVHKKVELVAQVVKPKVEVTRVMAPPKVEHKVLVREQKPQIVKIVPKMHTTTIVKEAPKPKPQMFLSQKRRQTIAKKIEIDQHRITAITPEHGYEAGLAGHGAVVSTIGGGNGFTGETIIGGNTGVTGGETIIAGNTGVTGGETIIAGNTGAAGFTGETFVSGHGMTGLTGLTGVTGGETIVSDNGMTGVTGETLVGGVQGETVVAGNNGNDGVVETTVTESRPRFTFGKASSASRFGTKI